MSALGFQIGAFQADAFQVSGQLPVVILFVRVTGVVVEYSSQGAVVVVSGTGSVSK